MASPNALYVIERGGNNARAALTAIQGGAPAGPTILSTALSFAADIGTIVDELKLAGAQHIIVWDTPNLGVAPAVEAGGALAAGLGTALAAGMNVALAARLAGIRSRDGDLTRSIGVRIYQRDGCLRGYPRRELQQL